MKMLSYYSIRYSPSGMWWMIHTNFVILFSGYASFHRWSHLDSIQPSPWSFTCKVLYYVHLFLLVYRHMVTEYSRLSWVWQNGVILQEGVRSKFLAEGSWWPSYWCCRVICAIPTIIGSILLALIIKETYAYMVCPVSRPPVVTCVVFNACVACLLGCSHYCKLSMKYLCHFLYTRVSYIIIHSNIEYIIYSLWF